MYSLQIYFFNSNFRRVVMLYSYPASVGRDSSVGVETRYGLDGPGIEYRWGRDFPHPSRPPASWGTGFFPGVKWPVCFGHVLRMPDTRTVKKIFKWKLLTKRSQGRPKYRWEDNIKQDIWQMKIKNWIACVQDRGK